MLCRHRPNHVHDPHLLRIARRRLRGRALRHRDRNLGLPPLWTTIGSQYEDGDGEVPMSSQTGRLSAGAVESRSLWRYRERLRAWRAFAIPAAAVWFGYGPIFSKRMFAVLDI